MNDINLINTHPTQFMFDLERCDGQKRTMQSFIKNEPNYDMGFYAGWKVLLVNKKFSFEEPCELLELLDLIQKCALIHLPLKRKVQGGVQPIHGRACQNGYYNFFGISKNYCSDEQGIKDLLKKIWTSGENLNLQTYGSNGGDYYLLSKEKLYFLPQGNRELEQIILTKEINKVEESTQKIFDILIPLYHLETCKNGSDRMIVINPLRADVREVKALELFNHYLTEIKKTETDEEKLKIISETMRDLLQLHLYWDGNARSLYILANFLLQNNGLSLFYPKNMCLFDANSVEKMIAEIQKGQERFKQMFVDEESLTLGLERYYKSICELEKLTENAPEKITQLFEERNFDLLLKKSTSKHDSIANYLLDHAHDLGVDVNPKKY